jgi:hypothetical protein
MSNLILAYIDQWQSAACMKLTCMKDAAKKTRGFNSDFVEVVDLLGCDAVSLGCFSTFRNNVVSSPFEGVVGPRRMPYAETGGSLSPQRWTLVFLRNVAKHEPSDTASHSARAGSRKHQCTGKRQQVWNVIMLRCATAVNEEGRALSTPWGMSRSGGITPFIQYLSSRCSWVAAFIARSWVGPRTDLDSRKGKERLSVIEPRKRASVSDWTKEKSVCQWSNQGKERVNDWTKEKSVCQWLNQGKERLSVIEPRKRASVSDWTKEKSVCQWLNQGKERLSVTEPRKRASVSDWTKEKSVCQWLNHDFLVVLLALWWIKCSEKSVEVRNRMLLRVPNLWGVTPSVVEQLPTSWPLFVSSKRREHITGQRCVTSQKTWLLCRTAAGASSFAKCTLVIFHVLLCSLATPLCARSGWWPI